MRRLAGLIALVLAFGVAGCGDDEEEPEGTGAETTEASSEPATEEPATDPETTESTAEDPGTGTTAPDTSAEEPTTAPGEPAYIAVYLVEGEHVSPVRRTVLGPALARAALEALLEGPRPDDGGRTTAVPTGTRLLDVALDDAGILTVDLSREFESGGGSLSMMLRVAQVVYTATQFPSVTGVSFRLDGEPVTAIGGEGLLVDRPQTPADFEDVTPPVLVQEPLPGDAVPCPIRARGTSNVFEATSLMGVTEEEGALPEEVTVVTASSGTGTRGTFDVEVPCSEEEPADGTAFLVSWWESAKDGSAQGVQHIPLQIVHSDPASDR